jgi:putative transcriptional regulator
MTESAPKPDYEAFGRAVYAARRAAKLTHEQVVARGGWDDKGQPAVGRRTAIEVEQGRANPSVLKIHAIAHATNTPLEELVKHLCDNHERPGAEPTEPEPPKRTPRPTRKRK